MDESIGATFAQCEALYAQLHLAQQVVVPVSLNYNSQGPDSLDPTFIDTATVSAKGELVYVPYHTIPANQQIPGTLIYIPRFALMPATLSATIQGQGSAQGPGHGGDFSVPAISVAIFASLPFAASASAASVAVQSSVRLLCYFQAQVGETTLPIELTSDAKGISSTVVLHLGTAVIVEGPPPIFGPVVDI